MTIELLFKIALLIVVAGIAIKLLKFVSGVVFKVALVMVVVLFFDQLLK